VSLKEEGEIVNWENLAKQPDPSGVDVELEFGGYSSTKSSTPLVTYQGQV
jgi:hypothetical protein